MTKSSQSRNSDIVTFSINSDGKEIADIVKVYSILINSEKNKVDEAIITVLPNQDQAMMTLSSDQEEELKAFLFEKEIEIKIGYENQNNKLFKGRVKQRKVINKNESGLFIQITCKQEESEQKLISEDKEPKTSLALTYEEDIMEVELYINSKERNVMNGYLKCQGTQYAKVGDLIDIRGFENIFPDESNNVALISQVSQSLNHGNWITTITVGNIS